MSLNIAAMVKEAVQPPKTDFELWLENLDEEDRADIEYARTNQHLPTAKLYRILKSVGAPIGEKSLRAWRDG